MCYVKVARPHLSFSFVFRYASFSRFTRIAFPLILSLSVSLNLVQQFDCHFLSCVNILYLVSCVLCFASCVKAAGREQGASPCLSLALVRQFSQGCLLGGTPSPSHPRRCNLSEIIARRLSSSVQLEEATEIVPNIK